MSGYVRRLEAELEALREQRDAVKSERDAAQAAERTLALQLAVLQAALTRNGRFYPSSASEWPMRGGELKSVWPSSGCASRSGRPSLTASPLRSRRWPRRSAAPGGHGVAPLNAAGAAESNGLVWSSLRRVEDPETRNPPCGGGSHAGRSREDHFGELIFPENASRRTRMRRSWRGRPTKRFGPRWRTAPPAFIGTRLRRWPGSSRPSTAGRTRSNWAPSSAPTRRRWESCGDRVGCGTGSRLGASARRPGGGPAVCGRRAGPWAQLPDQVVGGG